MFTQHAYIDDSHKPALESVIRQHEVVTEKLIAKLYLVALESFKSEGKLPQPQPSVSWSYVGGTDGNALSSATDEQTGIYVQLAGAKGKLLMLTVGTKWAMQAPSQHAIATKLW